MMMGSVTNHVTHVLLHRSVLLEVNPEAHAMRVSRPGTGMSMTHLHPEGKP